MLSVLRLFSTFNRAILKGWDTFRPNTHFGPTHFGPEHFGPRHFGLRHFGPTHISAPDISAQHTFRPRTFRPRIFWPCAFGRTKCYFASTIQAWFSVNRSQSLLTILLVFNSIFIAPFWHFIFLACFTEKCNKIQLFASVHEGQKPFQWGNCGSSFTKQNNLNGISIAKIHKGKGFFNSSICNDNFPQKSNFSRHVSAFYENKTQSTWV